MNKIMTSIFILPFIFVYLLPSFGIVLSDTTRLPFSFLVVPIVFFICLTFNTKKNIKSFFMYYKRTPFRYFVYLYIWFIITGICAVISNYYSLSYFMGAIIIGFMCRGFLFVLYPMITVPQYISIKSLSKIFLVLIYITIIVGFIDFFASFLNLTALFDFINFFANCANVDYILIESHSSIPRIKALTGEPSALAYIITAFLPFIYNLSNCKYRIFRNHFINIIIKKTIIPMSVICLILTQSPMGLLLAICVTIYVYHNKIITFTKKYVLLIAIFVSLICSYFLTNSISGFDTSGSYLIRIVNVVSSLVHGNFDEFITVEPSLATRIINYLNQFQLFLKYPFTGVGFLNRGWVLINHLNATTLPLTNEILQNLRNATSSVVVNMSTTSQLLYQTGFIGFCIYVLYMVKCIKSLNIITNFTNGLDKIFLISFKQHFVFIFLNAIIYNGNFMSPSTFFAMGLANSFIALLYYSEYHKNNYKEDKI